MSENTAIYLGADGQYHDDTPENREAYPAPEAAPEPADEQGTLTEAGSEAPPVAAEPAAKDKPAK